LIDVTDVKFQYPATVGAVNQAEQSSKQPLLHTDQQKVQFKSPEFQKKPEIHGRARDSLLN
jgi:hypothetical protein